MHSKGVIMKKELIVLLGLPAISRLKYWQSGKSSVSSILALHTALFRPGALVLMVSPSLRQSSDLFRKFLDYLDLLPDMPARNEDTRLSIKLDNNSHVVSLPGSEGTIRGYSSVDLLMLDEAARVVDDLYLQ
jgi:hypothetical protein